MRFISLLLIFLLGSFSLLAQVSKPKYANEFLSIGVGARSFAMGGANVASVSDASAGYWNPAKLMAIKSDYSLNLMHAEYFAGIAAYDYAGFATPIDEESTMGITFIRFGVDDIPDTRFLYDANGALNYDNIRFFSAADYAFQFSYARNLKFLEGLSFGANAKVIHRTVGEFAKAWGFGFDLGASYKYKNLDIGLMARDVTGTFTTWYHNVTMIEQIYNQTNNEIPENSTELAVPRLILGTAYTQKLPYKFSVLAEVNFDATFDGQRNTYISEDKFSIDPRAGIELAYDNMAFLRFGGNNLQKIKNFNGTERWNGQANMGLGFKYKILQIDYAFTDLGNSSESLYSHIFSVILNWNAKE
ncbi:PorV/PorQ family protein [Marivirga sp. S37H4]|uniref:PorV/PorQ family protein n=1 Tax=Marivirga aurantiaca TaxID=2802615 RepID=A0A935C7D0_9BACT|nr:PorV/PorQ family protein [Marivirga aurantiaca]MBK6264850.1 PorV/PorQ family protein [Marivirga aurantiaca]